MPENLNGAYYARNSWPGPSTAPRTESRAEGAYTYSDKVLVPSEIGHIFPEHNREDDYPIPYEPGITTGSGERNTINGAQGGISKPNSGEDGQVQPQGLCGLSRKVSWLLGVFVSILLIGAVAGGVAGGLLSRNTTGPQQDEGEPNPNSKPSGPNVTRIGTHIAAVNFTTSGNVSRRALFYQGETGSLRVIIYSEGNDTGTNIDIGESFSRDRNVERYSPPKNGTPIAAAAIPPGETDFNNRSFGIGLYYLADDNNVRELLTHEEDLMTWIIGGMQPFTLDASDQSQLAAAPNICPDGCLDALCVVWQRRDQLLTVACGNNWTLQQQPSIAYPGTSIAMIPFASDNGHNITRPNSLRMFSQRDNSVQHCGFNDGEWNTYGYIISNQNTVNSVLPKIVAAPSQSLSHHIVISMTADGLFTGSFYGPTEFWEYDQGIRFANEGGEETDDHPRDLNFTAVAMDHAGSFYGLTANRTHVVRYAWDYSHPFDLRWQQNIGI